MINFFYTIIIYPIKQILELCYYINYSIFRNPGLSICGISVAVTVLTLPLYFMAEKQQTKERDIQNKLKQKISKIKAVFKGDERYMLLSVLYRQNGYHPVFALRSSLALIIQIPFFIAAYSYLSNLDTLIGASFFFIKDLSKPDELFLFNDISLNVLPLLMTIINIFSASIYTKQLIMREKIQLYGIAVIFLILLYNSPSGLVLYWTMNNLFSLIKNVLQNIQAKNKIILGLSTSFILTVEIYLAFFHRGNPITRFFIGSLLFLIFIFFHIYFSSSKNKDKDPLNFVHYLLSLIIVFLHTGIVIPAIIISSSVREFSFIEQLNSPFQFILTTAAQSAGIFIFWPICLYFLFSKSAKYIFTIIAVFFSTIFLANTFLVPEKFGFLTATMQFSEASQYQGYYKMVIFNIILIFIIIFFIYLIFRLKQFKILFAYQFIAVISLFLYGSFNLFNIRSEFIKYDAERITSSSIDTLEPVYSLSKNGKNVVLILVDNFVSGFLPHILAEKPELHKIFTGWRYYPNNISYANHTLVGVFPIYGGYEYTPKRINQRNNISLLEKQTESYLLLPSIFSNANFTSIVTDPPFDNYLETNLGIFKNHPDINAINLCGKYSSQWLKKNPNLTGMSVSDILKRDLLYFSFFKCSPIFLRLKIYDNGDWLAVKQNRNKRGLTKEVIDYYALFDSLTELTVIDNSSKNIFLSIYEPLPHEDCFFQYPDYTPRSIVTNLGPSVFANENFYHIDMATILLLGKWISFLKENNVYDNTRIIVVSDHGRGNSQLLNFPHLPDGHILQSYNALLMVKDFYSQGNIQTDNTFMTNADIPWLLISDLIKDPVNPFTGNRITIDKNNGALITTIDALRSSTHTRYELKIKPDQWLFVKDNIFNPNNWKHEISN